MKKKENPRLITFENLPKEKRWQACINALETEYTLTFKEMCKTLKCHRTWAEKYLKPHLNYIYLANGASGGPNFVKLASKELCKEITESIWFSRTEFIELVKNNITSITRQTINVPVESFIMPSKLHEFKKEYLTILQINEIVGYVGDLEAYNMKKKLIKERDDVIRKYGTKKGIKKWFDKPDPYKRTNTEHIKCEIEDLDIFKLDAVHDLKDYGDSEEEVYRMLFNAGSYRLVLEIPDVNGIKSKKIYYLIPKNLKDDLKDSVEYINIKYSNY